MKRIILLFVIILLSSGVTLAQRWEIAPQVGISAGLPYNEIYYPSAGIDFGVTGAYRINSLVVEADLVYSHTFAERGLDFISVPVKAKYYITGGFNLFVGPQVDFYLNNKAFYDYDGGHGPDPHHVFFTLMGGAGYRFDRGFNISLSYNYKVTESYKNVRSSEHMHGVKLTFSKYFKLGKYSI